MLVALVDELLIEYLNIRLFMHTGVPKNRNHVLILRTILVLTSF